MKEIAIIFVGGTPKQNEFWWPSYNSCSAGIKHDMILVHRNMQGVPSHVPTSKYAENAILMENLMLEDKILPEGEVPYKAFGAYRHYFKKYASDYKYFAFISDDVYLRRQNWLKDVIEMFEKYPKLGMISPMLHNNPSHARAPIWFGKTQCLNKVNWEFQDDHDGEMTMADRCVDAGYFVAQIGHKVDFAYDPDWDGYANPRVCGSPQPNQMIERIWFGDEHFKMYYSVEEIASLEKYKAMLFSESVSEEIADLRISNNLQLQRWNVCFEIQPYHGLIYNKSLHIVKEEGYKYKQYTEPVFSGYLMPERRVYFGPSQGRYQCAGVNEFNPIAILE